MKARRGITLIESTAVITMFAVILTTVALALHAMRQANRHVRDEAQVEADWMRFAAQLRSDAHQAESARLEKSGQAGPPAEVLKFALADGQTVEYALETPTIERVLRRGQAVMHRETYSLPASVNCKWRVAKDARSPLVSLVLEPAAGQGARETASVPHRVDAAVHLFPSNSREQKP